MPFDEIVAFLHDFDAPLVVEMPHRDDPMARRLLGRKRDGLFDHYDRPQWEAALGPPFTVGEQVTLPSGHRTLYRCHPALRRPAGSVERRQPGDEDREQLADRVP